jgi:hypothetical protein
MAAEFLVVHLKIRHRPAGLTAPAIATQDLLAQILIQQGVEPQGNGSWANQTGSVARGRYDRRDRTSHRFIG